MPTFLTEEQQREYEETMWQESLSQGEYMREALHQYASAHGADRPGDRWILSPYDTWENNPHWDGSDPYQPHPEDEEGIRLYYEVGAHAVHLWEMHMAEEIVDRVFADDLADDDEVPF